RHCDISIHNCPSAGRRRLSGTKMSGSERMPAWLQIDGLWLHYAWNNVRLPNRFPRLSVPCIRVHRRQPPRTPERTPNQTVVWAAPNHIKPRLLTGRISQSATSQALFADGDDLVAVVCSPR